MNRERERERIEQQDPQPGMSWHDRQWNAGAGVAEGLTLRERLLQRARAIEAGDRVTAALLRAASDQLGAERAALAEAIVAHMPTGATHEIERMRKERDEARRWFCYEFSDARAEADRRGWDCFKGATDGK